MSTSVGPHDRSQIYYWKCDRAAAFHRIAASSATMIEGALRGALERVFAGKPVSVQSAGGQGNHLTYLAAVGSEQYFVRVEDGPERDDYLEIESHVLGEVARIGVPVPRVLACDASRTEVPFAWQVLEYLALPDLNELKKQGQLEPITVAESIGAAVARWQGINPKQFGPFGTRALKETGALVGFHSSYEDYFFLHLDRHLHFLGKNAFLTKEQSDEIRHEIEQARGLLVLERGCLVHKDLALWNILGSPTQIAGFIDWDDTISGDPMDDFSLLGCFYDGPVLARALAGYGRHRALPKEHRRRFWLHLLRNMIVKAVIRVGAGYFKRNDGFFLIGAGDSGLDLESFTRARLSAALRGLREEREIESL